MVIPSRDTNSDGAVTHKDFEGISGSPLFINNDCHMGSLLPSGLIWGTATISDRVNKISSTIALVHGPDVLGKMIDKMNTFVAPDLERGTDELENATQLLLTYYVQKNLVSLGYEITIDGQYGRATKEAVLDFQKRHFGSEEDFDFMVIPGVVDVYTWEMLCPELAGLTKQQLYDEANQIVTKAFGA
jgi:hypothetical protein